MSEITLTKQQEKCVNYEGGDLLVKGVAGSGKSYVLLSRAKKAHDKYPNLKTTIFTFQNTLVKYTRSLLDLQLSENAINVSTVDGYCKWIYIYMKKLPSDTKFKKIDKEVVEEVLTRYQEKTGKEHRLFDKEPEFWIDEFDWIRGKCIKTCDEYLSAERIGRGCQVRVTKTDRKLIWSVYLVLLDIMKKKNMIDWNDIYIYINDHLDEIPEHKKIDYVFVDEAQDMTWGKMKVLKALTRKTITIAADAAQKIFKFSFTWKEVGIDITGSGSKSLSKSFRSTKQIVRLAEDIMKENRKSAPDNSEYTKAVLPEIEGILPRLCKCGSIYLQNRYIKSLLEGIDLTKFRVGIIAHSEQELETLRKAFYILKIKYQYIDPHKNDWNILEPGVKLVKAYSSKGLEFDFVIIPYLIDSVYPYKPNRTDKEAMEEYLRQQRSVLYVAMTRAKIGLIMLTVRGSESRFIDSFAANHYEVENV